MWSGLYFKMALASVILTHLYLLRVRFLFLRFNKILTFTLSLSTLSYNPPHSSSDSWALFSLIAIACIYVYTCKYLNITFLLCIVLLVYMFGTGQPIDVFFPGKDPLPGSQLSSVAYGCVRRVETPVGFSMSTLACLLVSSLFSSLSGSPIFF